MTVSRSNTPRSLAALTHRLFDYAGLYPPAALSIDAAVTEYHRLRTSQDARLCGPFVVDPARLPSVVAAYSALTDETLDISLLAGTRAPLAEDVNRISGSASERGGRFRVVQIESRWPDEGDVSRSGSTTKLLAELINVTSPLSPARVYFEINPTNRVLPTLATAVADWNSGGAIKSGLKIRCGGATPADVPRAADVAHFLRTCTRTGAPFKATAGLHHAVRVRDTHFGGYQYGFFNLFAAALIAQAQPSVDAPTLEAVLTDTAPTSFSFTNSRLRWRHLSVPTAIVAQGRKRTAISIGSCSISEPAEELGRMTTHYHAYQSS